MAGRLISMEASKIRELNAKQILEAIRLSEGRVMAAETVGAVQSLLYDISNAELAAAMSADILILNMYDVNEPVIKGLPEHKKPESIFVLKKLTGRIIGINLEPTDRKGDDLWKMSQGRRATAQNARKAKEQGADIIVVTGNPGNHVTNSAICDSIKEIRRELGDEIILISGKMHASGQLDEAGENIISKEEIKGFAQARADIILLPAPGTVPGMTVEKVHELIVYIHSLNKMAMTSIGTSQEGADTDTIKTIAYNCKMAGADIHHIGDAGYTGIAVPENIMTYSIVIRGVRHTYRKMAQSINR
ncbi:MAG: haloacid dehalogenase-like hydrolase [Erysipelotrichaceae bacterium]|nr:haloacid dehalogenase-like hydrolase [Erysipelotrichaceae bacterium]